MRFFILLGALFIAASFTVQAQQFEWKAALHSFADNREYIKSGRFSQTIFGARFSPEIGIKLDSAHRIRVGFNALYEFGSRKFMSEVDPVLYYQYKKENWNFLMGAFPRQNLITDYPRAILNDTLRYYRPNVEGMLVRYQNETLKETVWIDWTSRQTKLDRETFLVGFSGQYKPSNFFIDHHAMLYHFAGPGIPIEGDHIKDNAAVSLKAGVDLSDEFLFDSLTVSIGGLMSFERTRNLTGWVIPKGALMEVHAERYHIGFTNTLYLGEGHTIIYGDKFYTTDVYNRTDLSWTPLSYKGIEGGFVFSIHMLEGVFDNQQAFQVRYTIGGSHSIPN